MKLLQLNTWAGRVEGPLEDFIVKHQFDIICLQEGISFPKENAAISLSIENIQTLGKLKYSAAAPLFTFRLMNSQANFGNFILSKEPIVKSEVVFTRLQHQTNFDFNEHDYNARNFVHAVIEANGEICNIITHHGHHVPEHKNGNKETLRQMGIIAEYIDDLEGPIILSGDFNLIPASPSIGIINERLENLSAKHGLRTTRTQLTHKKEVCDYIFVNKQVAVKKFWASDEILSDHKALILEFEI